MNGRDLFLDCKVNECASNFLTSFFSPFNFSCLSIVFVVNMLTAVA